ncbi:hypothetical protein [Streptomyces cinerochromogenes]|nr:hypothetical protein [Streptomyces cinerochromogenes]GGS53373.1 hypothetical protein GCM10010206_13710 [Streptomyces cinerochromogenes]
MHERVQATITVTGSALAGRIGPGPARALRDALTSDGGAPPLVAAP